jgi:hypothetical protein
MARAHMLVLAVSLVCTNAPGAPTETLRYPLDTAAGLRLHNVAAEPADFAGKRGLRITLSDETVRRFKTMPGGDVDDVQARVGQYASIEGLEFSDGVITAELAGGRPPDADPFARGFVGIAFRLRDGAYNLFNLRMTNGRAEDQERRNHTAQYASHPEWPWFRLRQELPSRYEAYVDVVPDTWTKVRIEVRGERAWFYVHDQPQPTLVVSDLKTDARRTGTVALWINYGTVAHFRDVTVTPHRHVVNAEEHHAGT